MTDIADRPSRARAIIVAVIAIVIVAGTLIAVASMASTNTNTPASEPTTGATETTPPADADDEGDDVKQSPTPLASTLLPEALGGQAAIDALGERISLVATRNGKSVDEVKELLLRDETARVSTSGFIKYVDDFGAQS